LDGAEACLGGVTFASKTLVSKSTIIVHHITIQQSRKHFQKNLGGQAGKTNGVEGL